MKITAANNDQATALRQAFMDHALFTLEGAGLKAQFTSRTLECSPSHRIGAWDVELELEQASVTASAPPTIWNGPEDGLPPVGTVCELRTRNGGWGEAEIKYHGRAICVWLWVRHDGNTEQIEHAECPDRLEFRPIRTAEQLAAEERERAITEMCNIVRLTSHKSDPEIRKYVAELYNAGCRLVKS